MAKIAVILFPGTNCEEETKRAVESAGMEAEIIRWNSKENIKKYDGFILPGGWSYEDRIRAGAISAKDPVMKIIKEEAKKGKPVLGICNGAQVLVETGMIPGLKGRVEMALAPNINPKVSGFYCVWTNIVNPQKKKNAFNLFIEEGEVLAMPIAIGEGRFTTKDKDLVQKLIDSQQIMFLYCNENGDVTNEFPVNPTSSISNIAGICNKEGNVMAMVPHPERANWLKQVPGVEKKSFEEMENAGPGRKIFLSMKKFIEGEK